MITEERLQEMKRVYNIPGDYEFPDGDSAMMAGDICELIAALEATNEDAEMQHEIHMMLVKDAVAKYEQAQSELAEAWGRIDIEVSLESEVADLRKQLAFCEQQAHIYLEQHEKLRELLEEKDKQLAASQAEVERLSRTMIVIDNDPR